jgi:beta-glucanase (GH16 family)
MRKKLGSLLVLALVATATLAFGNTAASAAPAFSARLSTNYALNGERIRISGAVPPAKRPVSLQRLHRGSWITVSSTRTTTGGAYAFTVRASSTAFVYRAFAPKKNVKGKKLPARYSNNLRVAAVRPTFSMSVAGAPVGQTQGGAVDTTPGLAAFKPSRPGAAVAVQQLVGGAWKTVMTGARQDSTGVARFQLRAGSATNPTTFRAVTAPAAGVAQVISAAMTPVYLRQVWEDNFSGDTLNPANWQTREQAAFGRRLCSTPSARRVLVGNGMATLSIAKKRDSTTSTCPYGQFENAMIGTSAAVPGFTATYGTFAARIKFQSGQGQHGSFWLQGPKGTGAEIDVAEYFGDGRPDGGLSNFIHYNDPNGKLSSAGGIHPVKNVLGSGRTPSNGWHVYSVDWNPSGYIFRMDGTPVFSTNKPYVATAKEGMILSLLTSDYELPRLKSTASTMHVDWVRAWQR